MRHLLSLLLLFATIGVAHAAANGESLNRTLFTSVLLLFFVFILVFWYWKLHLKFPSESALAMLMGIGVAGIARSIGAWHPGEAFDFNETWFSTVILPLVCSVSLVCLFVCVRVSCCVTVYFFFFSAFACDFLSDTPSCSP